MSLDVMLTKLVKPTVTGLGYVLWGVEYSGSRDNVRVVIYIDSPNGITVDDCEKVSRQVSALFDVEEPIQAAYRLEVSSPGADRKLFAADQFQQMAGHTVKLELDQLYEGRRRWKGIIVGVEGDNEIVLQADDEQLVIPYECITKARIVPQF